MSEEKKDGFFGRLFKRVNTSGEDVSPERVPRPESRKKGFFGRLRDRSVTESPTEDGPEMPVADGPAALVADRPEPPTEDGSEVPIADGPESPAADGSEVPIADGAAAPVADDPESPPAGDPEIPVADSPAAPAADGPESPVADSPAAPASDDSETPSADGSEIPVADSPESPAADGPETPMTGGADEVADTPAESERTGWLSRLKKGLSKSSNHLSTGIADLFTKRRLDEETLQDLEDILLRADLGADMSARIAESVSKGRYDKEIDPEEVKQILADEVAEVLRPVAVPFEFREEHKPYVVLVIGVNGSGKTTTIGKLAAIATSEGYSVVLAACDTFRAAAIEQLRVWGERAGADVVSAPQGSDASSLAFDAFKRTRENGADILIVDTAGRLQNKTDLMAELEKTTRVIGKQDNSAPHSVLLVLDATTGQNAISQTDMFLKTAGVTGLIMTKLDGTARGGILVAIADRFGLPIHAIGVGEQAADLRPFDADEFARAIVGLDDETD